MRKRKVTYPAAKTTTSSTRSASAARDPRAVMATVATIDLTALGGRDDLSVGDRVRIGGGGLYSGQVAVVTELSAGVIPAAIVRTEEGRTRRVRAVDLELVPPER